ncbi:MAG: tRNA pseudouridine synthase A [Promethearchaeota archaeon]
MKRMERNRYLFKMYYFGNSKYYGSQRQPNLLTIEECVLDALKAKNYVKNIKTSGFEVASRTDRFVSARGACFTCVLEKRPILMEINSALPVDIGLWAYAKVAPDFLSRYNAILRHYLYLVPFSHSTYQKTHDVDIPIMQKACSELEGRHDFVNFSKREKDEKFTIKDMDLAKLSLKNEYLVFQFKSRAFLRQQVRRMVKKILELGLGEINYDDFLKLFDPTQNLSYQPADPKGLILWEVKYDSNIRFEEDKKSKERMEIFFLGKELNAKFKEQLFRILQHNDFS